MQLDEEGFVTHFRHGGRTDDLLKLRGVSTSKAALCDAIVCSHGFFVDVELGDDGVDILHVHLGQLSRDNAVMIEAALKEVFTRGLFCVPRRCPCA